MSNEEQGENCLGYVKRKLLGSEERYVSPTPRNARKGFEETTPDRAEVVEVEDNRDGFPQHWGLFNRSKGTVDHRPGPGKPVEKGVPLDSALEPYEHEYTTRKYLRRTGDNT